MAALKTKFPKGGEVIVPPLTWVSDITFCFILFKPVFVDIDFQHYQLIPKTLYQRLQIKQ